MAASSGANERAFRVVLLGVFALTFLKGFRFPNLWSATHFTFNYSQGFVRRGLVGEVARRVFGDDVYRYNNFVVFSFLVLLAVGILMGLVIHRAIRQDARDFGLKVALLVVCASPGMIFLVHSVGYFDFLGVLALLGVLLWGVRTSSRFAIFYVALAVGSVFPFIHEGLVVMFTPTLFFMMACHIAREASRQRLTRSDWILLLGHATVAAVLLLIPSLLLSVSGTDDIARVQALRAFAAKHADFALRPDAYEVLTRSARENITRIVPWFWTLPPSREAATAGQIGFVPGFLFLLYYALHLVVRSSLPLQIRAGLGAALVAAALVPELMNFVGWDWPRWNSISMLTCLICILAYKLFLPAKPAPETPLSALTLGVLLAATGLASTTFLFDNHEVQFFPFVKHFEFLRSLFQHHFTFKPPA